MVTKIQGETANELFISAAQHLLREGHYVSPRGMNTLEINDAWLTLHNPMHSIVDLKERDIDTKYLFGEINWYEFGGLAVKEIAQYSKFWNKLQNEDGTVNSNYGHIAFREPNEYGTTQFDWCKKKLRDDRATRQAVIVYNQPKYQYEENKDFVCTLSQMFRVNNNKLDCTTMMRSNDLIFGLSYDLPWFTLVQRKMALQTNIALGQYQHYAASLHVYEKHFGMLEKMARAESAESRNLWREL